MKKIFCFLLISLSLYTFAVEPTGYYNAAIGKTGDALRLSLQTIITNGHSVTSYGGLYTAYGTTDINPTTGKIWDMYSNCSFTYGTDENHGTNGAECTNYNREHTSPQSWFGGVLPMYSDLFNVYPTDTKVNGERGNYPYGEVATASYTSGNGSKVGSSSMIEYSGTVFEPVNDYKGDFARTYLYMATRYASICQTWVSGATDIYGSNSGFSTYAVALFLKWTRQDPVSAKETGRNDAVQAVQHNRNPFIDHPELAEYIWGTHKGEAWSLISAVDEVKIAFSISPNPVQNELAINTDEMNLTYTVYNLNGQTLIQNQLNVDKTIPVNNLKNGMYLLQLKSGNRKTIQKFIVSN
jgi:endonuclease I